MDLLVTAEGRFETWRGDGVGGFELQVTYPAAGKVQSPQLRDIDDDGRLDLLYTISGESRRVAIRRGAASGFDEATEHEVPYAGSAIWDDLDGDGRLDIIVTGGDEPVCDQLCSGADSGGAVLYGTLASFAAPVTFSPGRLVCYSCFGMPVPGPIAALDFDRDGTKDLILPGYHGVRGLRLSAKQPVRLPLNAGLRTDALVLRSSDVDEDRQRELVVGTSLHDQQPETLWRRVRIGNDALNVDAELGVTRGDANDAIVTDVNEDGREDLVFRYGSSSTATIGVVVSDEDSRFSSPAILHSRQPYPMLVDAIDGSEGVDILTAQGRLLSGTGRGSFGGLRVPLPPGRWVTRVEASDFNSDGKPDLLAVSNLGLDVLLNENGGFPAVHWRYAASVGFSQRVVMGDFDNDGVSDLVVSRDFQGGVVPLRGRGDGSFEELALSPTDRWSFGVLTDLNGDQRLDLLLGAGGLFALQGDGAGGFAPMQATLPDLAFAEYLAARDLNRDGNSELIVIGREPAAIDVVQLLIVAGTSEPGFGGELHRLELGSAGQERTAIVVDVDGDRRLDVVSTRPPEYPLVPSGLKIHYTDKNAAVAQTVELDVDGGKVDSLRAPDLDGDGRVELVAMRANDSLAVFRADERGEFERLEFGARGYSLADADLDGDGDLDLVTGAPPDQALIVYWNHSELVLPRFRRGDVDGDGNLVISDLIGLLNFLFLGGAAIACEDAGDLTDSGALGLSSAIFGLNYLFLGGPEPSPPGARDCGIDPTEDELRCARQPGC